MCEKKSPPKRSELQAGGWIAVWPGSFPLPKTPMLYHNVSCPPTKTSLRVPDLQKSEHTRWDAV